MTKLNVLCVEVVKTLSHVLQESYYQKKFTINIHIRKQYLYALKNIPWREELRRHNTFKTWQCK